MPKTISKQTWDDLFKKASVLKPEIQEWKDAMNKLTEEALTPQEAKDVYLVAPIGTRQNGAAYRIWLSTCDEEFLKIKTAHEAMELFPLVPRGSAIQKRIASRWFELAEDFFHARKLYLVDGISALLRQKADDKQRRIAEEAGLSMIQAVSELYLKQSPA